MLNIYHFIAQIANEAWTSMPLVNTGLLGFMLYQLFRCSREIAGMRAELTSLQQNMTSHKADNSEDE